MNSKFKIPENEVWYSFAKSSGPGGQNVNKVSSKVTLHWSPLNSSVIKQSLHARLLDHFRDKGLLDRQSTVKITCQTSRSQAYNRRLALDKLETLIETALRPVKTRKKTRPSRKQRTERLKDKKMRAAVKELRRKSFE